MSEYVSRCFVQWNGQEITDFKSFTENERELAKTVNLMNKTGVMSVTPRHGFKIDYVVPSDTEEIDFAAAAAKNGSFSVEKENAKRVTFSGVTVLKIGEEKIDGENETVKPIEFVATKRTEE